MSDLYQLFVRAMYALAQGIHTVLPDWVRLPNLTFELPHLAYWGGLVVFPLVAMYLVRREVRKGTIQRAGLPLAYLLWLGGGYVGLHRFYLRAHRIGFVYIALFAVLLFGNKQGSFALDALSKARNTLVGAEFDVTRFQEAVERGADGAAAQLAQAQQMLTEVQANMADATLLLDQWQTFSGGIGLVILILLVVDAVRMRRLTKRCNEIEAREPPPPEVVIIDRGEVGDPRNRIRTPFTDFVERVNGWAGEFIAYWSVIAVIVYFYEVLARYVFNSPTNWAHESMFLMFGMQYLLSGGFAHREDAHVRVDVIYERFSIRTRAKIDVTTSIFFFIFTVALLVTGTIFALDSVSVWEVSFTEWAVQWWVVKLSFTVGSVLIIAQGLSKLVKDIAYLRGVRA